MTIKEILKETKGVFKRPEKAYYFGKIKYGAPYFEPMNFVSSIIKVRKLKLRSPEELEEWNNDHPHNKNKPDHKYSNYPMVRRAKNKIVKVFNYITWGWPISVKSVELGWKDKWESPRYEWAPQFHIFFFGLQFCIWWNAPKMKDEKYSDNDKYYEMILQYLKYADKDIEKAKETWGWTDSKTKQTTWNDDYLIK